MLELLQKEFKFCIKKFKGISMKQKIRLFTYRVLCAAFFVATAAFSFNQNKIAAFIAIVGSLIFVYKIEQSVKEIENAKEKLNLP